MSESTDAIKASKNMFTFKNYLMILIYVSKHARKESIDMQCVASQVMQTYKAVVAGARECSNLSY